MGCGCGGGNQTNGTFRVKLNDGTYLSQTFTDETAARIALARSGKGGKVEPQR